MSDFDSDDYGDYQTDDDTQDEFDYDHTEIYPTGLDGSHQHEMKIDSNINLHNIDVESMDTSRLFNYQFYKNKLKSYPDGDYISVIHKEWKLNFDRLEDHHGFVQWLFPLFINSGVNYLAHKLEYIEARIFRNDLEIALKILESYKMMLNFYGMTLSNIETGEIKRHKDTRFQKERYRNLSCNSHNNLRISRIITFLGHVGFQRYKLPFINFLDSEIKSNELKVSKYSLEKFWKPLVDHRNKKEYHQQTLETNEHLENESILFKRLKEILNNDLL